MVDTAPAVLVTRDETDKAVAVLRQIVEKYKETAAFPVAEVRLGEIGASN